MIFRVNKTSDYTVVSNIHLKDKNLSLKAKGLLTIMLSLPDDWHYSIKGLTNICLESETAITTGLSELKKFGYVVVKKILPNESERKKIEYEYNIFEVPQNQEVGFQGVEIQGVEIQGVENQGLEVQGQLNTNRVNTNISSTNNKNISCPKKPSDEETRTWYEAIYKIYPRKVNKNEGFATYEHKIRRLNKEEAYKKSNKIYKTLKNQVLIWKKEERALQYIPYLSSWLNANIENSPYYNRGKL